MVEWRLKWHESSIGRPSKTNSLRITPEAAEYWVTCSPYAAWRSTIIFLISAMALAGFSPFGQTLAQFMMVWQR